MKIIFFCFSLLMIHTSFSRERPAQNFTIDLSKIESQKNSQNKSQGDKKGTSPRKKIKVGKQNLSRTMEPVIFKKGDIQPKALKKLLVKKFKKPLNNREIKALKREIMAYSGRAVPTLVEVMKKKVFPDKSRWVATFLLGQIMGHKAAPFIVKFLKHPNWVLRMASLKTLMALKQTQYKKEFNHALKDNSFIVRKQALDTIRYLNLKDSASHVWAMLYDKKNYHTSQKAKKRTNLIKEAVKTVGDLKFVKARQPLFKMIQKKKYEDIFAEMDYSLEKITGKKSPKKDIYTKRRFWSKVAVSYKTI